MEVSKYLTFMLSEFLKVRISIWLNYVSRKPQLILKGNI